MKKIKAFLPGTCWTVLILILSCLPASTLHLPDFWDLFSLDKLSHAIFYSFLFSLWVLSFRLNGKILNKRECIYLMIACIAFGGLIELMQGSFLVNRTADYVDELANSIGVVMAYILNKRRKQDKSLKELY